MSDLAKRLSGLRSISSLSSHGSAFSRLKSQDSSEIPKGLFEAAAQLAGAAPAPSIEMAEPPEAPSEIEVQGATQILDTNFKVEQQPSRSSWAANVQWRTQGRQTSSRPDHRLLLYAQVVVRVRPPLQREVNSGFHNTVAVDSANRVITLSEDLKSLARGLTQEANLVRLLAVQIPCSRCVETFPYTQSQGAGLQVFSTYRFKFDHVHDPASDQPEVYSQSAKGAVLSALQVCCSTLRALSACLLLSCHCKLTASNLLLMSTRYVSVCGIMVQLWYRGTMQLSSRMARQALERPSPWRVHMKVSPPLPHQPQQVRSQQRQHSQQANSMMPNRVYF